MALQFTRATKTKIKLRMALDGPSGAGKTYTGLVFATTLAGPNGKVAVIDTERGSARKYADQFTFDVLELTTFAPSLYIEAIKTAESAGYDVILIDSLSHAWEGEGGVLEQHEQATLREPGHNSYTAWRTVTPEHRKLVDAMLASKCHIIGTMRSKMEYAQVEDERGKKTVKKLGMAPIQRQGMEYEFDIVADMDIDHNMIVSKSRCFAVADDVVKKPGAAWFGKVMAWLDDGNAPVVTTGKSDGDSKPPAPAWQAAFFGWMKDWLGNNALLDGPNAGKAFYDWCKAEGYMKEHLGMYSTLAAAQNDMMAATSKYKIAQAKKTSLPPAAGPDVGDGDNMTVGL